MEGTYDPDVKLKNIHLPHRLFREIFGQRQSIASMNIKSMQMIGLSPIFEGWDFYSEIHASVALINKNRFIFCISLLNSPELANNIFKDYNDKWFFNEQVTHMVAYEMANQIKKEVIKRQEKGTSVFFDKFNEKNIEVRYQIQKIEYSQRRSFLTNEAI